MPIDNILLLNIAMAALYCLQSWTLQGSSVLWHGIIDLHEVLQDFSVLSLYQSLISPVVQHNSWVFLRRFLGILPCPNRHIQPVTAADSDTEMSGRAERVMDTCSIGQMRKKSSKAIQTSLGDLPAWNLQIPLRDGFSAHQRAMCFRDSLWEKNHLIQSSLA